jgi:hypothetical protein
VDKDEGLAFELELKDVNILLFLESYNENIDILLCCIVMFMLFCSTFFYKMIANLNYCLVLINLLKFRQILFQILYFMTKVKFSILI